MRVGNIFTNHDKTMQRAYRRRQRQRRQRKRKQRHRHLCEQWKARERAKIDAILWQTWEGNVRKDIAYQDCMRVHTAAKRALLGELKEKHNQLLANDLSTYHHVMSPPVPQATRTWYEWLFT